jgi:mono/diheme cytochrome c family protein
MLAPMHGYTGSPHLNIVPYLLGAFFTGAAGASIILAQEALDGPQLYADYCAGRHCASLEGQPDWMVRKPDGEPPAPPYDESGHTWHHSDKQLLTIVRDGLEALVRGYRTDMPAFGNELSEAEITAILDYIKSRWPERERAVQAAKSAAHPS